MTSVPAHAVWPCASAGLVRKKTTGVGGNAHAQYSLGTEATWAGETGLQCAERLSAELLESCSGEEQSQFREECTGHHPEHSSNAKRGHSSGPGTDNAPKRSRTDDEANGAFNAGAGFAGSASAGAAAPDVPLAHQFRLLSQMLEMLGDDKEMQARAALKATGWTDAQAALQWHFSQCLPAPGRPEGTGRPDGIRLKWAASSHSRPLNYELQYRRCGASEWCTAPKRTEKLRAVKQDLQPGKSFSMMLHGTQQHCR